MTTISATSCDTLIIGAKRKIDAAQMDSEHSKVRRGADSVMSTTALIDGPRPQTDPPNAKTAPLLPRPSEPTKLIRAGFRVRQVPMSRRDLAAEDLSGRLEEFENAARLVYRYFQRDASNEPSDATQTLGLFLAPEWFFRRAPRAYSEADKKTLVARLSRLSSECEGMLIVAGTMVWSPFNLPNPPWIYNTCHVFMDGELVHEVDKTNPGCDTRPYGSRCSLASRRQSPLFEVRGIPMAIEICADHTCGVALKAVQDAGDKREQRLPKAHILISAGRTTVPEMLPSGERLLSYRCDGTDPQAAVRLFEGRRLFTERIASQGQESLALQESRDPQTGDAVGGLTICCEAPDAVTIPVARTQDDKR